MVSHKTSTTTGRSELLTLAEVLAELDVPKPTFFRWKALGRAPRTIKYPNGSLRVRRSDLEAWIAAHEETQHEHFLRRTDMGHPGASRPRPVDQKASHDVPRPVYVAGETFGKSFQTRAMAESFRSRLIVAQREGVAFDTVIGLPEPMAREAKSRTWYEHAVSFVDMKWPRASAKHRRSIADALATVTPALFVTGRGAPPDEKVRRALYTYAFDKGARDAGPPPDDLVAAVCWLGSNTEKLTHLADAAIVRKALNLLATRLDGKPAAPNTAAGVGFG